MPEHIYALLWELIFAFWSQIDFFQTKKQGFFTWICYFCSVDTHTTPKLKLIKCKKTKQLDLIWLGLVHLKTDELDYLLSPMTDVLAIEIILSRDHLQPSFSYEASYGTSFALVFLTHLTLRVKSIKTDAREVSYQASYECLDFRWSRL